MGQNFQKSVLFFFFIIISILMTSVSLGEAATVNSDGSWQAGQPDSNCYCWGSPDDDDEFWSLPNYFTNTHCKNAGDMILNCLDSCLSGKSSENPSFCCDICMADCSIKLNQDPSFKQELALCYSNCPPDSTPITNNECPEERRVTKYCCCDPGFSKWYNSCIKDDEIPGKVICGKWGCQEDENCLNCPEDCGCMPPEVCDPFSPVINLENKCSPPVAALLISKDMSLFEYACVLKRLLPYKELYEKKGYFILFKRVDGINDVSNYLVNASTKVLIYGGHACGPSIENADAAGVQGSLYSVGLRKWRDYGLDNTVAIQNANDRSGNPNLEAVYIFTCGSLDDTTLADYLLQPGGTYYGHRGDLYAHESLEEYVKPR